MILYLSIFLASLALSTLLTPWVRTIAIARGLITPPTSRRHLHTKALPRLGGVAICISFLITLAAFVPISRLTHTDFPARTLLGLLLPASIVFLLGVYDDIRPLEPKSKIAVQAVAAILLYFAGFGIHYSGSILGGHFIAKVIGLPLTIFWVLLITNAFNLIDGLDGLAAGSALVSAIVLFAISLLGHNDVVAILVIALAGAILGFLPSNFYPASIFMGDSGSLFIGFLLSAVALIGPQATSSMAGVAIPVLIFGLPILDVTLAVARRFLRGQSLFHGDADHIHHKLLKRGLSQRRAVLVLYAVTVAFGAVSLIVVQDAKWLIPVLVAVVIGVLLGVRQLHYVEFSRLPAAWQGVSQRHEISADQARILHATESLRSCGDFRAICKILRETLQPIGFDGIRLKNLGNGHLPASSVHPLKYDSEGGLLFTWSEWKTDDPQPGEWRSELVISSHATLGHVSLFRVAAADEDLQMELDILSEDFRTALSKAIGRVMNRVKPSRRAPKNTPKARAVAAGTSTESATGR
jgi:UDP-GlcNAc:undecaprenyl-phosphate/decaprenyl-phosphate GlcNAc-1-phosphate transferase